MPEHQRPLNDFPRPRERCPEMEPVRDPVGNRGPGHDEHGRSDDEHGQRHGQADREQPDFPPRPAFVNVVGLVQRVDDRGHAGRGAPDRADHAEGEQAAVLVLGDLDDLLLNEAEHLARRDPGQGRGDRLQQILDRDEGDQREQEQERREEREEKVIGELRRQAQAVVGDDFTSGPPEDLAPSDGNAQRSEHQWFAGARRSPVPTVGVHEGASLAGNDSADASSMALAWPSRDPPTTRVNH